MTMTMMMVTDDDNDSHLFALTPHYMLVERWSSSSALSLPPSVLLLALDVKSLRQGGHCGQIGYGGRVFVGPEGLAGLRAEFRSSW